VGVNSWTAANIIPSVLLFCLWFLAVNW